MGKVCRRAGPQQAETRRLTLVDTLVPHSAMVVRSSPRKRDSLLDRKVHDIEGIVHRLVNSSFGSFNSAVEHIRALIPQVELTLPRVVVLGSRDAGKSSLLENITKCPIFPRGKGLCTRMPINQLSFTAS